MRDWANSDTTKNETLTRAFKGDEKIYVEQIGQVISGLQPSL